MRKVVISLFLKFKREPMNVTCQYKGVSMPASNTHMTVFPASPTGISLKSEAEAYV